MTPQEQTMLQDLLDKLAQTPSPVQDSQAAAMIQQSLGRRSDALYILTQIVMMQNLALEQAQQEIQALRQAAPASPSTSFLGGMGTTPASRTSVPSFSSGTPSFLHSIMSTAAGVVAGEATFDVLRSLFGGSSSSGMSSGGFFGGNAAMEPPREETIINNNYYDDNASSTNDNSFDTGSDNSFQSDEDI